jgi:5-formyltetrahydrofolate cyclo-ligase
LVRHALRHRLLAAGKRVGFYIPANGEIDVMPLLYRAYAMGVQCYLPVVPGRGHRKLWFSRLDSQPHLSHHWRLNRFGIPEYLAPKGQKLRIAWLQRVFMPMLGFDEGGYRIGMGGGYYDASLAFRALRKKWRVPPLVGVAFSAQQAERIPHDPWDVPLDDVLTERGLMRSVRGTS